jgi:hypothetical protein
MYAMGLFGEVWVAAGPRRDRLDAFATTPSATRSTAALHD